MTVGQLWRLLRLYEQDSLFIIVSNGEDVPIGTVRAVRRELLKLNHTAKLHIEAVGDDGHPSYNCLVFVD